MKSKVKIICIILALVASVCLFMPCVLTETFMANQSAGWWKTAWSNSVNAFASYSFFSYVCLVGMLLSALLMILEMNGKAINLYVVSVMFGGSLACLILTVLTGTPDHKMTESYIEYTANWMFYIIVALELVCVVLTILLAQNKFDDNVSAPKTTNDGSTTRQLQDLKALYDSGVITQEEFDAKKKQLLDL